MFSFFSIFQIKNFGVTLAKCKKYTYFVTPSLMLNQCYSFALAGTNKGDYQTPNQNMNVFRL